jgi:hypothetical protein
MWQVSPLRDPAGHDDAFPVGFVKARPFGAESVARGYFDLLVCAGCGDARWFARDVDLEDGIGLVPHKGKPCASCQDERRLRSYPFDVRGHDGIGESWRFGIDRGQHFTGSTMTLDLCMSCRLCTWTSHELADLREVARSLEDAEPAPGPCEACHRDSERWRLRPTLPRRGVLRLTRGRGALLVDICVHCGRASWCVPDRDGMKSDPAAGILERTAGPSVEGGPYR